MKKFHRKTLLFLVILVLTLSFYQQTFASVNGIFIKEISGTTELQSDASGQPLFQFDIDPTVFTHDEVKLEKFEIVCNPGNLLQKATLKQDNNKILEEDFVNDTSGQVGKIRFTPPELLIKGGTVLHFSILVDTQKILQPRAIFCRLDYAEFKNLVTGQVYTSDQGTVSILHQVSVPRLIKTSEPTITLNSETMVLTPTIFISTLYSGGYTPQMHNDDPVSSPVSERLFLQGGTNNLITALDITSQKHIMIDDIFVACKNSSAFNNIRLRSQTFRYDQGKKPDIVKVYDNNADHFVDYQIAVFSDLHFEVIPSGESDLKLYGNTETLYGGHPKCFIQAINSHSYDPQRANEVINPLDIKGIGLENAIAISVTQFVPGFFPPDPNRTRIFQDVPANHPQVRAIEYLYHQQIARGYSDISQMDFQNKRDPEVSFQPDARINRAEAVAMFIRANKPFFIGQERFTHFTYEDCFPDVQEGEWYHQDVCWASKDEQNGYMEPKWIQGYSDGYFHPERNVSRVEAIKMILLSSDIITPPETKNTYPWYTPYIPLAEEIGLTYNDPDLRQPNEAISRAEMAEMIYRTHQWLREHKYN